MILLYNITFIKMDSKNDENINDVWHSLVK